MVQVLTRQLLDSLPGLRQAAPQHCLPTRTSVLWPQRGPPLPHLNVLAADRAAAVGRSRAAQHHLRLLVHVGGQRCDGVRRQAPADDAHRVGQGLQLLHAACTSHDRRRFCGQYLSLAHLVGHLVRVQRVVRALLHSVLQRAAIRARVGGVLRRPWLGLLAGLPPLGGLGLRAPAPLGLPAACQAGRPLGPATPCTGSLARRGRSLVSSCMYCSRSSCACSRWAKSRSALPPAPSGELAGLALQPGSASAAAAPAGSLPHWLGRAPVLLLAGRRVLGPGVLLVLRSHHKGTSGRQAGRRRLGHCPHRRACRALANAKSRSCRAVHRQLGKTLVGRPGRKRPADRPAAPDARAGCSPAAPRHPGWRPETMRLQPGGGCHSTAAPLQCGQSSGCSPAGRTGHRPRPPWHLRALSAPSHRLGR